MTRLREIFAGQGYSIHQSKFFIRLFRQISGRWNCLLKGTATRFTNQWACWNPKAGLQAEWHLQYDEIAFRQLRVLNSMIPFNIRRHLDCQFKSKMTRSMALLYRALHSAEEVHMINDGFDQGGKQEKKPNICSQMGVELDEKMEGKKFSIYSNCQEVSEAHHDSKKCLKCQLLDKYLRMKMRDSGTLFAFCAEVFLDCRAEFLSSYFG